MLFNIGEFVKSNVFNGIGKIISLNEALGVVNVSFFESPLKANTRIQEIELENINSVELNDETIVYCIEPSTNKWCRVRYGGKRPGDEHLIIYRRGDNALVDIADLYVLNLAENTSLNPKEFLSSRSTDTPHFSEWRSQFISSYIAQRASCRSISSLLSSSVELEPYQIAVVKHVLQDEEKKYLLADEVGLGKTIEAGLILRELILEKPDSIVVVSVPDAIVEQWKQELSERFFLGDLFDISLFICSHTNLSETLQEYKPSIFILDEAHLIAPLAWSDDVFDAFYYRQVEEAAEHSESCLLLSGTPLTGNENNFLSMLHLLSPKSYQLSKQGIKEFKTKIVEREKLGGIYQALQDSNDNSTLTDNIELIDSMFPEDGELIGIIGTLRPLVDWLSDEEGVERSAVIKTLRKYLGDNYRLHQRLLRNRREDPSVALLFPGLNGSKKEIWPIHDECISIEMCLDSFRSEYLTAEKTTVAITQSNYLKWMEDALVSPLLIKNRATSALGQFCNIISNSEKIELETLIEFSQLEQIQKDQAVLEFITAWLGTNHKGKIVLFCGDTIVAKHVYSILVEVFHEQVELHQKEKTPKFGTNTEVNILICDQFGEDGLNLNGGKKLVIHYSLPLSISRIEQRLGRVNRYSANVRAEPIENVVFLPKSNSFSHYWYDLLNDDIGIFNDSVASLQYVLEEKILKAWSNIVSHGINVVVELSDLLSGERGLIVQEKKRITTQEQLNSMEADIEEVSKFADELLDSDKLAEEIALYMSNWIVKGLNFRKLTGELPDTFRFKYQSGGTLMDVKSFISQCVLGLDFENSSYESPVTGLMSFDRGICSQGKKISPFRYGQPFIETIFNSLKTDSRGICSARVRNLPNVKLSKPIAGFKLEWLVSHLKSKESHTQQKVYDEIYQPHLVNHWFFSSGKLIENQSIVDLLEKEYEPYDKTSCEQYQDINLRAERWPSIEDDFPEEHWPELVDNIYKESMIKISGDVTAQFKGQLGFDCMSMSVVILSNLSG